MKNVLVIVLIVSFAGSSCKNAQTQREQKPQAAAEPEGLSVSDWTGTVYTYKASAYKHRVEKKQEETLAFLKEQQWSLEFATEVASQRSERSGFEVPAEVQPRAGGQGQVTAPLDGRLVEASAIPIGQSVSRGDVLARIAPPTTAPGDVAAVGLATAEAEDPLRVARRDRARAR